MLRSIQVMGDYWHEDDTPTGLGTLLSRAKDAQEAVAVRELCSQLAAFARSLPALDATAVVAVPPGPDRDAHPVPSLAAAVATALGMDLAPMVERRHETARLRDTPIERRPEVVEAAGYAVVGDVTSRRLLLVDDVILTGTTLGHVAGLLVTAGAADVQALVVCRTRRLRRHRDDGR